LYPNPASNQITVDLKDADSYTIKLIDLTGKEVANLIFTDGVIQLPQVSFGVYLIQIQNTKSGQTHVKKIIIQN
jgi:hypothetical protein